jgi:phosphoribosyl 1,2-cyclic phosphate phosphodiesterase
MAYPKLKITVLGSGSSTGVPAAGNYWGKCNPANPKNTRTRASLLVQSEKTTVLIDTSYDLRAQLNTFDIQKIDAVLWTHPHSDHINGIDDLKMISFRMGHSLQGFADKATHDEIGRRWPYLYKGSKDGVYKPFIVIDMITAYQPFTVGDLEILPILQDHGTMPSLGFRFGHFAYSIDLLNLDDRALDALMGLETWIVDGAGYYNDWVKTHASFPRVFEWVKRITPKQTYISDVTVNMDHDSLLAELPEHIRPAYDGLRLEV